MTVTRDDVAQAAGVSSATVSRAFNTPSLVAPDKVRRIAAAAKKLGYVPDRHASALRRRGTGIVMFLQRRASGPVSMDERFYRWLYADALSGVVSAVDATMLNLEISMFGDVSELRALLKRRPSDAIVCHGALSLEERVVLRRNSVPFVVCKQMPPDSNSYSCSYVDEFHGGFVAGKALADTGHTQPCHITGALDTVRVCGARWEGFRSAFPGADPLLVNGALGIQGGHDSAQAVVDRVRRHRIDCIFVVNDLTAVGVVQALLSAGIRIPRDISIVGYDNLPFVQTLPVQLTTVDLNYASCYREGTTRLLQSLAMPEPFVVRTEPFLVKGESVQARQS